MTNCHRTSFQLQRASFITGAFFLVCSQGLGYAGAEAELVTTLAGPAVIVDGDTIDISGQRLRLEGIDAPETAQTCATANGGTWDCGREAARVLRVLLANAEVACDSRGNDKYGRMLATCFSDGKDVNATMVKTGYAWAFVKYSSTYREEEKAAQAGRQGVWQGHAIPPWEYRHNGWQIAEGSSPQGCAIKGNISHSDQIYHMPWSPWYDKVKIDTARGERWFCSEGEAQAAGWRPALTN
jgi:endonuclease YncB( thermonuclease family)